MVIETLLSSGAVMLCATLAAWRRSSTYADMMQCVSRQQKLTSRRLAGRQSPRNAWANGAKGFFKGSFKGSEPESAPLDVVTYSDSPSGHLGVPVSAESAQAAFNDACGDSFHRREDVAHPGMHIGKSGGVSPCTSYCKSIALAQSQRSTCSLSHHNCTRASCALCNLQVSTQICLNVILCSHDWHDSGWLCTTAGCTALLSAKAVQILWRMWHCCSHVPSVCNHNAWPPALSNDAMR